MTADTENTSNHAEQTPEENHKDRTETDLLKIAGINLDSYATKKSIAQAILDLGLLCANISQLKYILSVGEKHEFYGVILWLVVSSIALQIIQAILCVILALVFNLNKVDEHRAADIINNVSLCIIIATVVINVVITGFDIKDSDTVKEILGKSI